MPYPEPPVESSPPELGSALRARLAHPELLEFLRRSLQIRELGCAFGLPRRLSARVSRRWLGAPHVRIALASGPLFDGTFCDVALPAEQAVELVDRILGGSGRAGVPGKVGLPTAAERGVLAYFAARCARACADDLRVEDVRCESSSPEPADAIVWPVRLSARDGFELDLKLIFASPARCPRDTLSARIGLLDTLEGELALAPGDLVTSDQWALHMTSAGPCGLLQLSVAGSSERALLELDAGTLRLARGEPPSLQGSTAELVVATFSVSFPRLAELLDDEGLACPPLAEATLLRRGRRLAHGRLVRFQGQLALEVV